MQLIPKRGNEEPLHGTRATRAPTFSTTCAAEMPNCSQVSGWISTVLGSRLCSTAGVTVSLNFVASHVGTLLSSLIVPERRKARGGEELFSGGRCDVLLCHLGHKIGGLPNQSCSIASQLLFRHRVSVLEQPRA